MAEPTFTLTQESHTWLVRDAEDHILQVTDYGTGHIDVKPQHGGREGFLFLQSDLTLVLAIGRLLVAAARKCGANEV
jgi:hypothetical protein